jgi:hypothetical protein
MRRHKLRIAAFAAALSLGLVAAYLSPLAVGSEPNPVPVTGAPATSSLSALGRVPAIALPAEVAATAEHFSQGVGEISLNAVRRLESGLGSEGVSVYALPVAAGQVCYYISSAVAPGGSCVGSFDDQLPVAVSVYAGTGIPPTVAGLAPDGVTAVDVLVDGSRHPAELGNNVIFFEAVGSERTDLGGVVVHYRSGASRTVNFNLQQDE